MTRAARWIGAIGLVWLIGLLGCAPRYPYTLAPGHEGAPGVDAVVLVPLNLAVALAPELEAPAGRVHDQIAAYLEHRGKAVTAIGVYDSRQLWVESISRAKKADAESGFEAAAPIFVGLLGERYAFDAVLMPSLVYRKAKRQGLRSVRWDGVTREVGVVGSASRALAVAPAEIGGVSLHVMVYDREGKRVFERFGGIDLAHEFEVEATRFRLRIKEPVLGDRAALRQGIRIAFHPYIPASSESAAARP